MTTTQTQLRTPVIAPRPSWKAVVLTGGLALLAIGAAAGTEWVATGGDLTLASLVWLLIGIIVLAGIAMYVALRVLLKWTWHDIGFRRARVSLLHLFWEIPLVMVIVPLTSMAVLGALGSQQAGEAQGFGDLHAAASPWAFVPLAIGIIFVVPILEEIFFRRLLIDFFGRWMPIGVAIALAAVIFGLVHFVPPVMFYTLLLGVACGLLYWRHGTLWAPIAMHAVNNAFSVGATMSLMYLA